MKALTIRKVHLNDISQLQTIGRETFYSTFVDTCSTADLEQYLEEGFSTEKLTLELHDQNSEFYFAVFDGNTVGYLKLNFGVSQTELQDHQSMEIERIYVLESFQGKKVGLALYNKALQIAIERAMQYIWLGVWENNLKALSFYKKQGFVEFDQHIFKVGNDEQIDLLMKLELSEN